MDSAASALDVIGLLVGNEKLAAHEDEGSTLGATLSNHLQEAASAIGDDVMAGAEVGEPVTVSNDAGILLNLMKEDPGQLANVGSQVGEFILPPSAREGSTGGFQTS